MNWVKENKFIAAFLIFVALASGGLIYFLITERAKYEEATAMYEEQAAELVRLQDLSPYPKQKNLEAMESQRNEHQGAIGALQKTLMSGTLPEEPLTQVQFQDRLRETVLRVREKAEKSDQKMKLPEKFYMGFDKYETEPPRPEAAPILGKQLKAMEQAVMLLIENRVLSLDSLDREPIPEESDKSKPAVETKPGLKFDKAPKELVLKRPFEMKFTGDQTGFQSVLNGLVNSTVQFYIPTHIEVKNEKEVGPPKGSAVSELDPLAPIPGGPVTAPAPKPAEGDFKYIVGEEKVTVAMRVEIVDFVDPSAK